MPNLKAQEQAINEQREAVLLVAESYGFEEKSLKELEKRLDQVKKARELFTGGTNDAEIALAGFVDILDGQAQKALLRQELGLAGSSEEVERQRRVLQELIQEWTAVVNSGDDTLLPFLAKLKQAYDDLAPDEKNVEEERKYTADINRVRLESLNEDLDAIARAEENKRQERIATIRLEQKLSQTFLAIQRARVPTLQEVANAELEIIRQTEAAKQNIWSSSFAAFSNLSRLASGDSKGIAVALLAVEKGLRIADVIVNAKASIAKITAAAAVQSMAGDLTASARAARNIGVVKTSAAVSIAAIVAQGLAQGAQTLGGGRVGGAGRREQEEPFGFQMNRVEGPQTFRTPGFMPENGMMPKETAIKVEILADGKQLYSVVKRGEEQYRQRSI